MQYVPPQIFSPNPSACSVSIKTLHFLPKQMILKRIAIEPVLKDHNIGHKIWSFKAGALWWHFLLNCNVGPARNMSSFKTGGLSWQWSLKTGFSVPLDIKIIKFISHWCRRSSKTESGLQQVVTVPPPPSVAVTMCYGMSSQLARPTLGPNCRNTHLVMTNMLVTNLCW